MISKDISTEQTEKTPETKEKERILTLILKSSNPMVSDYKNTIKHVGGLLTNSMVFAYAKGIQDTLKLLTKEEK